MTLGNPIVRPCVVLSPHLDDAVLSLGSALAAAARSAARIRVVTVFAGRVDSRRPAGDWDSRAGFRTEGEAARARRAEDSAACATVGVEPVHLPFGDRQYEVDADADLLRAILGEIRADELVLVPGLPLAQPDHLRLYELVRRAHGQIENEVAFYLEQPYAALAGVRPDPEVWIRLPATAEDRARKLRALRAYDSQIELLGGARALTGLIAHEVRQGGELIRRAVVDGPGATDSASAADD